VISKNDIKRRPPALELELSIVVITEAFFEVIRRICKETVHIALAPAVLDEASFAALLSGPEETGELTPEFHQHFWRDLDGFRRQVLQRLPGPLRQRVDVPQHAGGPEDALVPDVAPEGALMGVPLGGDLRGDVAVNVAGCLDQHLRADRIGQ